MAKQKSSGDDILLNINVTGRDNLNGATDDAKKLNKELKDGGKTDLAAPVKSLKSQLKDAVAEAQRLFAAGKQNTQEYAEAAKKVTALRNDIDELNNTFKAFDPDNKFRVFANAATAGAKAVQGYAGAMAFLGVESEDATQTIAKLQGIMAFADAIDSLGDLKDSFNDVLRLVGLTSTATVELTAVEEARAAVQATTLDATAELTEAESAYLTAAAEASAATEGLAASEELATEASITLGGALKAIGIGLIISALAYLITNFDKVKKVIVELFPSLGDTGKAMDKLYQSIYGVGNVILQFLVAPIKVLIDLIRGDFKGALKDLADGIDVVGNYNAGVTKKAAEQAEEARKVRVQKEIDANERIIKERKALGENTTKLEVDNLRKKLSIMDADSKTYEKDRADAMSEITVIQNSELKRRSDAYKAALKTDLDQIKANNEEATKILKEGSANQRATEITDLDIKYQKELSLLNKRKQNIKDYNKEYANLVEARGIEEQRINKKYGDAIQAYQDEIDQTYDSQYEKRAKEIEKRANELLKNASPTEAAKIQSDKAFQLSRNTTESIASDASQKANTLLTDVENVNRPDPKDTPEEAVNKINNVAKAKLEADNAAYELRKAQLEGQYNELAQLDADHEKNKTDIERDQADARKQIAEAEAQNRLKLFDAIAQGASTASDIIGGTTIAGKALAVAAATISTYAAIAGQLEAFSKVPIPGYAIAQAIATGLVGLANVKNILKVKVPGSAGGSSAGGVSAPIINSTVLSRENSGSNDVVDAVGKRNEEPQTIKAYITNKDLSVQKEKEDYFDAQSTY